MDYGQTNNPSSQSVDGFFTSGAGTNQEDLNNFESENNLNLDSDGAASWGQAPDRDPRKLGNEVISSSLGPNLGEATQNSEPNLQADPQMPPGYVEITEPSSDNANIETISENIIDFSTIKEGKDKSISKESLKNTEKAVHEFEKGNMTPAELDNLRWQTTEAYLKNSFNREVGKAA